MNGRLQRHAEHMSVLVVGSVAYDSVKTAAGGRDGALGGSATYFSIASSYFTSVTMVAVVGDDFRREHLELLESHRIDVSGLQHLQGKTFRWTGTYGAEDINRRKTLDTQLNVFAHFSPKLSDKQRRHPYLFLANIAPKLQLDVLSQMEARPKIVALDTMNLWIEDEKSSLTRVVKAADVVFMDEGEARMFSGEINIVRTAKHILSLGPTTMVVKRGEHGALLFTRDSIFAVPAFPLENVVDPTGAGDSFAGGFMGYLASTGDFRPEGFRKAAMLGSVMGSFAVESFSTDRLSSLTRSDIERRVHAFEQLSLLTPLNESDSLPWHDSR